MLLRTNLILITIIIITIVPLHHHPGPFAAPRSFFLRSLRKYLIRSELQPHRLVYRSGSDFTELGRIYSDVNEEGQVKARPADEHGEVERVEQPPGGKGLETEVFTVPS